jgi:hypothetical protein
MQDPASSDPLHPDRRTGERQISVLINAGIVHDGKDALCRIRNLSSGGVMVESSLSLAMDDRVTLQLRSGRMVEGVIRWIGEGRAGIAFSDPHASEMVTERLASGALATSPIGYPLFERQAWAQVIADHKRVRARIARISPSGITVEDGHDWRNEHVFSISIEGLGDHLARRVDGDASESDEEMHLIFVQPLHYRAFEDWLATMPRVMDDASAASTANAQKAMRP